MCNIRIVNPLGVKKISSHAHKTGSWYLLGVLSKISDEHSPSFFMWEFPPPPPRECGCINYCKLPTYFCVKVKNKRHKNHSLQPFYLTVDTLLSNIHQLHGATPLVHRFVLGNTSETPLTMRFDAKAPFKIMSTEPPPSASRTQAPGSITVKPTKTIEVTSLLMSFTHL